MKKVISLVLVVVLAFGIMGSLSSCGKTSNTDSLSVCLASEPDTIDPALNSAVDGATLIIHAFSGLAGYTQNKKGALELVAECAKELPEGTVDATTGKVTYVFTLRDDLKWSDGSALTAADFVYAWNRAADPITASDYGYMFDIIDGYAAVQEKYQLDEEGAIKLDSAGNPVYVDEAAKNAKLNVTASEDGKTLTVVINNVCPYFNELLAFPTYMPVKQSVIEENGEAWATDPATYVSNGPYTLTEWAHDSKLVYTKNENYYNADKITMNEIVFYLSDDQNTMLANYKNGDWLFIDDVPNAEISTLKKDYPKEFVTTGQLGTYYVIFNVNKDLLPSTSTLTGVAKEAAETEVRNALSLLLDRNYICESIGQAGQVPASSYVAMGLTDADGKTEFYQNAGDMKSNGYYGYYNTSADAMESNIASALETLKKYYTWDDASSKFTNFPTMEYIYNTSEGHKAIGEYIQSAFAAYGITMTLTNQEWNTFLNTRKDGDYSIARNGWLADYNDPISFLDMWITESGNNDAQFGKQANETLKAYSVDLSSLKIDYKVTDGTWAETYDYVIGLVKTTTDPDTRYGLMHIAEDLLMSTGAICPLYYYTDIYMISQSLTGVFSSPLGYKYFMYSKISK